METYVIMPSVIPAYREDAIYYSDVNLWIEHDLDSAIKRVVSLCERDADIDNKRATEHNAEVERLLSVGATEKQLALFGIHTMPVKHPAQLAESYRIMQDLGDGRFRVLLPIIEGLPCVSKWPWSTPVTSVYDIPLHWRPRSMKLED